MDMGTVILIMGLASGAIGIASYFGGRHSAAKKDGKSEGEFRGELRADLKHIQAGIEKLQAKVDNQSDKTDKAIERLQLIFPA